MIIDASFLQDVVPVSVHNLTAKATNIVVSDNAIMQRTLLFDSESVTLDGNLTLSGTLQDWTQVNVPTVKYFTNNGFLNIANEAHFGDDRTQPFTTFVSTGGISANGQVIHADYLSLSGSLNAFAGVSLWATNAELDGLSLLANSTMKLAGGNYRLAQTTIDCFSFLELSVTNSLTDDGVASPNAIFVVDGFFMSQKPATGNLLGTALTTAALPFAQVNHVWAGRDDGADASGYVDNTALGSLILQPQGADPYFVFSGAGSANGLYVEVLDLSQLTDFANQIQIDPNLTIYFAAAALSTNALPTNGLSAEEFLDGQFGGRLRWVASFAGPNSTTNVTINGNQVIAVNLALRKSSVLDSDADGTVNALDASPLDGVKIDSIVRNASPAGYLLTWDAAPNTLYQVESRTNLTSAAWQAVFTTTSTNSVVAPWTVLATNTAPAGVTRYYRVTYTPGN